MSYNTKRAPFVQAVSLDGTAQEVDFPGTAVYLQIWNNAGQAIDLYLDDSEDFISIPAAVEDNPSILELPPGAMHLSSVSIDSDATAGSVTVIAGVVSE